MKTIHAMVAAALIVAGTAAAVAQGLPTGQGVCAKGYAAAAPNGRLQLGAEVMKRVDLNNDGNISRSEFDAACAKRLFDETAKGG